MVQQLGTGQFVEFVLAWHGVMGATAMPFTAEKESAAYQKRIKRWTQRDYGIQWRFYWTVILKECWKARRQMVLQRNFFTMEPRGPNPSHRRRNLAVWTAVFELRQYFEQLTGQPQMGLLRRLLYPNQQEVTFHAEWHDRKVWFKGEDAVGRLEQRQRFYQQHRVRIHDILRTGTPLYARWASTPASAGPSEHPDDPHAANALPTSRVFNAWDHPHARWILEVRRIRGRYHVGRSSMDRLGEQVLSCWLHRGRSRQSSWSLAGRLGSQLTEGRACRSI